MQIDIYSQAGDKKGKLTLPKEIFEQPVLEGLMHDFVTMQAANARYALAHAKTRSERHGSTRKPWKQKGTGNARTGSRKGVQWRKGGRVHGPSKLQTWAKDMPQKMRRKALLSALSARAQDKAIFGLEKFSLKAPQTKVFAATLAKLPVKRSVLVVFAHNDLAARKSMRNLPQVKTILANYLNPRDVLQFEKICLMPESVEQLQNRFAK